MITKTYDWSNQVCRTSSTDPGPVQLILQIVVDGHSKCLFSQDFFTLVLNKYYLYIYQNMKVQTEYRRQVLRVE